MSRKEMEVLTNEQLEQISLGIEFTKDEAFRAQIVLANRNENKIDDEFYIWYDPTDDDFFNGYFGYPERGDYPRRRDS